MLTLPNILIVDESLDTLLALQTVLQPRGYGCQGAQSAASALRHAADTLFDALLTSVTLPKTDGWTLIKALALHGTLPKRVILMGDDLEQTYFGQVQPRHTHAYLCKPFHWLELLGALGA